MESFLETARTAVDAGIAYAQEQGLKMAVVVMDVTGTVCAAARMDGSRTIIYDIAVAKANTAREMEGATIDLKQRVLPENKIAIAELCPRPIAFLGGGLPIVREGTVIGAIGTSGGSEDQDVECAEVALAAVSARVA